MGPCRGGVGRGCFRYSATDVRMRTEVEMRISSQSACFPGRSETVFFSVLILDLTILPALYVSSELE